MTLSSSVYSAVQLIQFHALSLKKSPSVDDNKLRRYPFGPCRQVKVVQPHYEQGIVELHAEFRGKPQSKHWHTPVHATV